MTTPGARLRELLRIRPLVVAPFVFDGLQAKLAAAAGFEAVYMTGFGTAAARGLPDVGLLGLSEMVENVRVLVRAAGVPVVCDADTGYGNPVNVWHTVREYERAGAAGLHLEDQVWPKRCGFLAGKQVISLEEMLPKVRAACDARGDPDFVVIARTDALAPHGWEEAVRRARAYRDAGADLVFVDGIRTRGDMQRYARQLEGIPARLQRTAPGGGGGGLWLQADASHRNAARGVGPHAYRHGRARCDRRDRGRTSARPCGGPGKAAGS